ncbi:glycosyltransferase family protein [Nocardioides solisilvae]|uniref:glycosyltransferase family protein n=1 Tax=Nocardioides solisilvae TaxID=1542435 RepID=UPI0013A5789F|nr:glycosyltransferase [Nocardioides solisilvae]
MDDETARPGGARPTVLWQAGVPWDGVVGTDRQLVTRLARWTDVVWVDPPLSVVRSAGPRDALRGVRVGTPLPGVTRVTLPAPPWPYRPGVLPVTAALARTLLDRFLAAGPGRVDVVVATSPYLPLQPVPGARRVYYATDDFPAGAALMGQRPDRMAALEARRVAEAQTLGAVSPVIVERWPDRSAFVLPNGCDVDHHARVEEAPEPQDVSLEGRVAGVVGQLSERIDLALLEAVAGTGLSLLLVGPRLAGWGGARFDRLVARGNVQWVGRKEFAELPSYLRRIDVGLTPYADSAFNRASFPLKTLEYLAAGRAALSTPLPALELLATDLVAVASGPDEFAARAVALAHAAGDPREVEARRRFARRHGWEERARRLAGLLGLDVPG